MSVVNIFLFRDIVKVKIGIGSPSNPGTPTDGQEISEGNITYVYNASTTNWDITTKTNQVFVSGLSSAITKFFIRRYYKKW